MAWIGHFYHIQIVSSLWYRMYVAFHQAHCEVDLVTLNTVVEACVQKMSTLDDTREVQGFWLKFLQNENQ